MKTFLDMVAAAKQRVHLISLEQAEDAIGQADVLVDVREESEYVAGHLPGALHMSRGVVEARLSMRPDLHKPDANIVVYCRTDARASMVAVSLQEMGFQNVKVITGGFEAWSNAAKAIEKS